MGIRVKKFVLLQGSAQIFSVVCNITEKNHKKWRLKVNLTLPQLKHLKDS